MIKNAFSINRPCDRMYNLNIRKFTLFLQKWVHNKREPSAVVFVKFFSWDLQINQILIRTILYFCNFDITFLYKWISIKFSDIQMCNSASFVDLPYNVGPLY